jgi:hypothetical protein
LDLAVVLEQNVIRANGRFKHFINNKYRDQGSQIFLDTMYQNGEKCTKLPQNYQVIIKYTKYIIPNIFQMGMKYTNIFHSKALQNLPKVGFLV